MLRGRRAPFFGRGVGGEGDTSELWKDRLGTEPVSPGPSVCAGRRDLRGCATRGGPEECDRRPAARSASRDCGAGGAKRRTVEPRRTIGGETVSRGASGREEAAGGPERRRGPFVRARRGGRTSESRFRTSLPVFGLDLCFRSFFLRLLFALVFGLLFVPDLGRCGAPFNVRDFLQPAPYRQTAGPVSESVRTLRPTRPWGEGASALSGNVWSNRTR